MPFGLECVYCQKNLDIFEANTLSRVTRTSVTSQPISFYMHPLQEIITKQCVQEGNRPFP